MNTREAWGEITKTAVEHDRRVLPFQRGTLRRRSTDRELLAPPLRHQLPSSLAPEMFAPVTRTFRTPHRAVEVTVAAAAVMVAVFTALFIPIAYDADRSDLERARNASPVSVAPLP